MNKKEIVQLVASKTGLNEMMAAMAVDTVLNFVKDKLKDKIPAPFAGQLDQFFEDEKKEEKNDLASGAMDMLGSALGGFLKK